MGVRADALLREHSQPAIIARFLSQMDAMFGSGAAGAPPGAPATPATSAFLAGFVHNWGKEAFIRGAYSTPTFGEDYTAAAVLREPHAGGRVFFAGEATAGSVDGALRHLPQHRANYASPIVMHGAINSGALAATEIASSLGLPIEAAPSSGRLFTPTYKFVDTVATAAAAAALLAAHQHQHQQHPAPPPVASPPPALLVWKQAAPPSPLLRGYGGEEEEEEVAAAGAANAPAPAHSSPQHQQQHSPFSKQLGGQQQQQPLAPFVLAPSQRRRFKGFGPRSLPLLLLQAPHIMRISTWSSARKKSPTGAALEREESSQATTRASEPGHGGGFFHAKRVALLNQSSSASATPMSWKFW